MLLRASRDPEAPAAPAKTTSMEASRDGGKHRRARTWHGGTQTPKEPRRKRRLRLLLPVVVLTVMAFLYYRPLSSYLQTRDELGARRAQVVTLRAEKVRLERRLARTTSDAALAREARRIGYVKPGERLFIVKGIGAWQRSASRDDPVEFFTVEDRDVVERQIGRRPRAFHRVAARCPFGAPAVTEQSPYDSKGAPFPTTYYLTCRHLVAAVSRLEAAGGVERWSAAVAASPDLTADLAAATALQQRVRHELAAGSTGADHGASLDSGIGALATRRSSSASTPMSRSRSRSPGYRIGELVLAEVPEPFPADRCCVEAAPDAA